MSRRKGEDTSAMKQRRMPFVAKIKREDQWHSADSAEIHAMCKRIAASAEFCSFAGWAREDVGFKVIHFTTWAKARAMQHWIDRSGIAHRPVPKTGQTREELEAEKREAIEWALATGAGRRIAQAYRQKAATGAGHISAMCAAYDVAKAAGCKISGLNQAVESILQWVRDNHGGWFNRCYEVAAANEPPPPKPPAKVLPYKRPDPPEPAPPRWRPMF